MDIFTSSITSQTFKLSSFDAIVSHTNSSFVAFYRNDHHDQSKFMPVDMMRESFYRTLVHFPIMVGDLVQRDDGGLEVAVDQHDLNMPDYCESTVDDMHFKDVEATNFNPEFWPKGLIPWESVAIKDKKSGRIKLLQVHIVRFKDNSGLALAFNYVHAIGDAVYCRVWGNVWATEMRALEAGQPVAEIPLLFDRSIVQKCLPLERTPLDNTTKAFLTTPNAEAEAFARLPPHERHVLILDKINRDDMRRQSLFKFRAKELGELVQEVNEFVPDGVHLSTSDVMITVIAKTLAQAHRAITEASGIDTSDRGQSVHKIDFPCNVRRHLSVPDNYMGNVLYQILTYNTVEQVESPTTPQSIAEIAVKIRAGIKAVKAPLIAELFETLEADPTRFTRPLMAANIFQQTMSITNQRHASTFSVDFGYGVPEFAIVSPAIQLQMMCMLFAKPKWNDTYVTLAERSDVLELVCGNKAW
ncbi:hypothetical protein FBU59_004890, partial [Linderina macrospora]